MIQDGYQLRAGHDLRYVEQELNEISSGVTLGLPIPFNNRNSPIPQSYTVDPGLFVEYEESIEDVWLVRAGGRIDYTEANITDRQEKLNGIGIGLFPAPYANIVGTNEYEQNWLMPSVFFAVDRKYSEGLVGTVNAGFAQRAPNLTELYAAQPFMFLLQNGLNNVTGDPTLDQEKAFRLT